MDTTLIVNPGSSSKKYALFREGKEIFSGLFEESNDGVSKCVEVRGERKRCTDTNTGTFETALHDFLDIALQEKSIEALSEITRVGIRIVAPGTFFTTHRVIDGVYIRKLNALRDAAPLHIPHQLSELAILREAFPQARIVGVSDSAFHATMPEEARRYSIPTKKAQEFDLYRFGYHGLSVASIVRQVSVLERAIPEKIIVCHIGSGVSVTAVKNGKSVNTTMGFAPTSGLMMGARAGEVDPSAFAYLVKRLGGTVADAEMILNLDGGIKGMLGNSDLRIALDRATREDHEANVTVLMFMQGIRKAVGAMSAVLGGVDVLVLTGTAPERNPFVRASVVHGLEYLGLMFDVEKNEQLRSTAGVFSVDKSVAKGYVLHTEEFKEIYNVASVL